MPAARFDDRAGELAACQQLLEDALAGRGGALLVLGDAGIGKTTLLREVADTARSRQVRVLRARGRELDGDVAYGTVRELLATLGGDGPALTTGPAEKVAPFLAGAVPSGVEPFALRHALTWLVANLADRTPVALVVDDAHWADEPSLAWFESLAADVVDLPVALFLAVRPGYVGSGRLARLAGRARRLTVAPLGEVAAARVVAGSVPAASPAFVEACRRASGANPLLLAELVHAAVRAGVDPASDEVAVVDALVPDGVTTIVRGRLGTLDEPARVLLEVAALAGDGTRLRHLAAVVGCTVDDAGDRADRLLAQRFLDAADPVAFAHPLVQRAIADQVAPGRAGRVHRELARVHAAEHDRERACAHLLLAPPEGDDAVVRLLVEHAAAELDRGSPATAARFLARALDEPPSADRRTVLLALGEAENQLGRAEAIEHLAAAHALAATPAEAERCARSLARALAFHGRVGDAAGVLATALAASGDPGARARLRAETMLLVQNLEPSVGESPLDVPEVDGDVHAPGVAAMRAAVAYERALLWHGTAAEVSALCAGAFAGGLLEQEGMDGPSVAFGVQAAMVTGDWALTEKLLAEGEADARRRGSVRGLAAASGLRARYGVMCGRPDRAELDGRLAVALAREAHTVMLPYALAALVMGLTARGRLDEAQGLLEVHGMTGELPRNRLGTTLYLARTALACAQRRVADADRDAEALVALGWADRELPPVWTPVLVDARLLAGRTAEARRLAEVHLADARAWGAAPFVAEALLAAARAGLDEPATLAQEALDVLDGCEAPLVRATALTDLGAALRRANRRADAREPLARARELAHACGADALAERAYVELLAAGARPRRIERTGVEALTPSERRVVELAVQGMSNAQIAQHLFVTRKTVEKHLGSAYAKLQVGSRDELEAVLSGCGVVGG